MAGLTAPKIAFGVIAILGVLAVLGISIASLVIVVSNNNKIKHIDQDFHNTFDKESVNQIVNARSPPVQTQADKKKYDAYKSIVAMFKQSTDFKADPCNDFYKYTCGNYTNPLMSFDKSDAHNYKAMSDQFELPNYITSKSPIALQQVKQLYEVCKQVTPKDAWANLTSDGQQVFKQINMFKDVSGIGFPMLQQSTIVANKLTPTDLGKMLGYLSGALGTDTFVTLSIDTNWDDPNSNKGYALFVDQSTQRYANTYYQKVWKQIKDNYAKTITWRMNKLAEISGVKLDQSQLAVDVQAILDLEYLLATNMSTPDSVRRQYQRSYNPYTVATANAAFPNIDWAAYIKNLVSVADAPVQAAVTNPSYVFYIMEPARLSQLMDHLSSQSAPFSARQIVNYFYYRIVASNAGNMPSPSGIKEFNMEPTRRIGRAKRRHQSTRHVSRVFAKDDDKCDDACIKSNCAGTTMNMLMYSNARVFIDKIYDTPDKRVAVREHVGEVAASILNGMQSMIDQLSWMSHYTKKGAYDKINQLLINVAYPDFITNDTLLDQYYEDLDFRVCETDFFAISDSINRFNTKVAFQQLTAGKNNRRDFNSAPGTTNAWYQPERNSITFPAAILQRPFYDYDYPASVNFGAMGTIAGHELTHGFDDEGVQWDGTGVLSTWMDPSSNASFVKMAGCVIDEYNNFCPLPGNQRPCVDGSQTQGENIADNGGIHSAFRAYKNYVNFHGNDANLPDDIFDIFTQDQLFFMSFAQVWCQIPPDSDSLMAQLLTDPHSPSEQRVFGTIQNFPAFRNAFNCPAGTRYAPEKHCDVWISDVKPRQALDVSDTNIGQLQKSRDPKYQDITDYFAASMDNTIDPCDDFWGYACGNYNHSQGSIYRMQIRNILNVGAILNGNMAEYKNIHAMTNLKKHFNACKQFRGHGGQTSVIHDGTEVKSAVKSLQDTGFIFPLLDSKEADLSPTTLGKALGRLANQGVNSLLSFNIDTNWRNPHGPHPYLVYIDQPTLQADSGEYQPDPFRILGPGFIGTAAALLNYAVGPQVYKTQITNATVQSVAKTLVDLEKTLALSYSTSDTIRRDQGTMYNLMTLKQAQAAYPFIDWNSYMQEAFTNSGLNWNQTVWDQFMFSVSEPDQLAKLNDAIRNKKLSANTIANYLFFRTILNKADYTPLGVQNLEKLLEKTLNQKIGVVGNPSNGFRTPMTVDLSELNDDEQTIYYCSTQSMLEMSYANSRVFVDMLYPGQSFETTKAAVESVIDNILVSFRSMLDQLDWMSTSTKRDAYSKIDNTVKNIGFPDFVRNDTGLDNYYAGLNFADSDDFIAIRKKLSDFNNVQSFKQLSAATKDIDRRNFGGSSTIVNAWYAPNFNSITFPSGILQQPFFDPDWPAPAVFGAMGLVCGHELTHGFDDQGVQWDKTGVLSPWMDKESNKSFVQMAQCVIDQYGNFTPLAGTDYKPNHLLGAQTQGENIADNGGIHAAFRAYRDYMNINGPNKRLPGPIPSQFTNDQIFFLSYAQVWCEQPRSQQDQYLSILTDPHSPAKYRILGPMQNFPAFQAAFNCRKNTTYAPIDHCNVWISNATTGGAPSASRVNLKPAQTIKADNPKYPAYQSAAKILKSSLNTSFDPCNNFYEYACANYPQNQALSFNYARTNNYKIMAEQFASYKLDDLESDSALYKVKQYYDQCVNATNNMDNLIKDGTYVMEKIEAFKNLTGWSFSYGGEKDVAPKFDKTMFSKALAYLSAEHGIDTLVSPLVDTNPDVDSTIHETPEAYQLQIDQNSLVFMKSYYSDNATWEHTKLTYETSATSVIYNYTQVNGIKIDNATITANTLKLLEFEYLLAQSYSTNETDRRIFRRDGLSICTVNATGVLTCKHDSDGSPYPAKIDCIDFNVYLKTLTGDYKDIQDKVTAANYQFWILETEQIGDLCNYVENEKNFELVTNYFFYRILYANGGYLGQGAANKKQLGLKFPQEDALNADDARVTCAQSTLNQMQYANARVFYEAVVKDPTQLDTLKKNVLDLAQKILGSMQGMLDQLDWLSDQSKVGARAKVENLPINIAYPPFVENSNQTDLDKYYAQLKFTPEDDFFSMTSKLTKFNIYLQYNQLLQSKVDRRDFLGAPATVNAWYQPELNSITFPAGILVEPYFNADWPASINFGALGVIAGHELTHAFDDGGVQYNGTGQAENWLTDAQSQDGFKHMAQCVIDEYHGFCFKNKNGVNDTVCLNGDNTQGENIADNGGIHSAFRAYRLHSNLNGPDPLLDDLVLREFSHDQLFFLAFAQVWCQPPPTEAAIYSQILRDPHSPSRERVFGTIQNFPAFKSAFSCSAGSKYAPEKHCSVWVPGSQSV